MLGYLIIIPATHDIPEGDPCHSSTRGRFPQNRPVRYISWVTSQQQASPDLASVDVVTIISTPL
ncbi:hypothetical protein HZB03_03995 [Candidatus Woesearchaeota archaeon]|nr:hypothetical protein [Candidatus Woesearchaeota archaeon]